MEWQWQDHDYADGWCGGEEVTKWIDYGSCQCSLMCSLVPRVSLPIVILSLSFAGNGMLGLSYRIGT